jgi:hypothetical protein
LNPLKVDWLGHEPGVDSREPRDKPLPESLAQSQGGLRTINSDAVEGRRLPPGEPVHHRHDTGSRTTPDIQNAEGLSISVGADQVPADFIQERLNLGEIHREIVLEIGGAKPGILQIGRRSPIAPSRKPLGEHTHSFDDCEGMTHAIVRNARHITDGLEQRLGERARGRHGYN